MLNFSIHSVLRQLSAFLYDTLSQNSLYESYLEKGDKMNSLPTNVKQIGSIGEGMRIYVEDYVCTYLNQYAQAGGYDERLALLVGRYLLIDGQAVLFINGAIQGRYTEERDGRLYFTDKSRTYSESILSEFFEGSEIVGWMQSQPGYGIFLNQQYATHHFKDFPKINQVMFVVDPLEGLNAFYSYNDDRSSLLENRGYFIYYEKNTSMHEYMLRNNAEPAAKPKPAAFIETPKFEQADPTVESFYNLKESPEEIIRKRQEQRAIKKATTKDNRRTLNLLVSMSAVLFIVCFILGAGLMQSHDRIESMEFQIFQLNTAYRNLNNQMAANPVFAPAVATPVTASANEEEREDAIPAETVYEEAETGLEISGIPVHPPVNEQVAPSPPPPPVTAASIIPESYIIQSGDSLSAISMYFYGEDRIDDILALNGLENADMIIAGRTILLP